MTIRLRSKPRPFIKPNMVGIVSIEAKVYYVVGEAADVIAEEARVRAPKNTGALVRSIKVKRRGTHWRVTVGTDHWRYIEYGTPPHRIRPARKKALYWDGAKHPMGMVRHPGIQANPFMRNSLYQRRVIYQLPSGDIRVSRSSSRFVP